jgi:cell fate (sporulation/competence/biofilm development) regulator YmcA (YheA/YmcA/DUF963 family)
MSFQNKLFAQNYKNQQSIKKVINAINRIQTNIESNPLSKENS